MTAPAAKLPERRQASVPDLVAAIRSAIVDGDLVPNQRLVEVDLAEEFDASRGNVRAALAELTVEGLVERIQNRGARVRAVSVDEAVEITEVRAAVESLCARKAAERITPEQASVLRALGAEMAAAVESGDRERYSECNRRLHATIITVSGQETAAQTIHRLRGQAVRYQFKLSRLRDRPATSLPQHLAIIDAICGGDPEEAARAMWVHLQSVAEAIRAC